MVSQLVKHCLAIALAAGLTFAATACEVDGPPPDSPAGVTQADPAAPAPVPVPVPVPVPAESSALTVPDDDPLTRARSICDEGTIAECQAACDSGKPYTCLLLARMAHSGARTHRDPSLGESIARGSCKAGALESCAQLAKWRSDEDPVDAGTLAMRACSSPDASTARIGCGLWMHMLERGAFVPTGSDLIGGLKRVCKREQAGTVQAGAPLGASMQAFEYDGGACGRLKDLGMKPGDGAR